MRIVSLLPSATEILCTIGGRDMLVGRSHECDWPADVVSVPVLTAARTEFTTSAEVDALVSARMGAGEALYWLDEARLAALEPDVILTQDLCSVCSIDLNAVRTAASRLARPPRILSLNPTTLEGVLDDHLRIGEAVGLVEEAERAVVGLRERLYRAADFVNPFDDGPSVVCLDWTDPLYVAGHWTPQLVERAGGRHPLNPTAPVGESGAAAGPVGVTMRAAGPSRRIEPEELAAARPERIVVCPCGLPLEAAVAEARRLASRDWWAALPAVPRAGVAVVDGNQMFNRPGPRLVDAFEWLVGWVNGRAEVIPAGFPWVEWDGTGH